MHAAALQAQNLCTVEQLKEEESDRRIRSLQQEGRKCMSTVKCSSCVLSASIRKLLWSNCIQTADKLGNIPVPPIEQVKVYADYAPY